MTYHRYHGPSYIAQSTDNGVIWDRKKTQVSNSNGALPRLAKRESDGCYLVTYQTGGSTCYVWAKTTTDPYTVRFVDADSDGVWDDDEVGQYLTATDMLNAAGAPTSAVFVTSPYVLNFGVGLDEIFTYQAR